MLHASRQFNPFLVMLHSTVNNLVSTASVQWQHPAEVCLKQCAQHTGVLHLQSRTGSNFGFGQLPTRETMPYLAQRMGFC